MMGYGGPIDPDPTWTVYVIYVGGRTVYRDFMGPYMQASAQVAISRKKEHVADAMLVGPDEDIVKMCRGWWGITVEVSPCMPEYRP